MEIKLRNYQQECVNIIDNMESGSGLVVLFTGAGKTVIMSRIKRRGRVLILSHREELVHQPAKYFDCSFGFERAEETSNGEDVVSASVQTLVRRLDKFSPDDFDMIITDEAHHAAAPTYRKIYEYFKPRVHIGFTATPNRADNVRLGDIFEKILYERNIVWGIQNKHLVDIRCKRIDIKYDLKKVKTQMGDFAVGGLATAVDQPKFNKAVAKIYKEQAVGQTLIFAINVAHANHIAKLIPNSAVITGETTNRAEILQAFMEKKIKCIVNCMVLTEGTDLPCIETIIMCRPTRNISLYTQCIGRGTRKYEGKKELTLIDLVGASRLNICTASTLFGIDPKEEVNNQLITKIIERMEKQEEEPDLLDYIVNYSVEELDMFADELGYELHGIDFVKLFDGTLLVSLSDKLCFKVTPEDSVGNSFFICEKGKTILDKHKEKTQSCIDLIFTYLSANYENQRPLWDKSYPNPWRDEKASDKQKKYIRFLYQEEIKEKKLTPRKINELTKREAGYLISMKQ